MPAKKAPNDKADPIGKGLTIKHTGSAKDLSPKQQKLQGKYRSSDIKYTPDGKGSWNVLQKAITSTTGKDGKVYPPSKSNQQAMIPDSVRGEMYSDYGAEPPNTDTAQPDTQGVSFADFDEKTQANAMSVAQTLLKKQLDPNNPEDEQTLIQFAMQISGQGEAPPEDLHSIVQEAVGKAGGPDALQQFNAPIPQQTLPGMKPGNPIDAVGGNPQADILKRILGQ